MSDTSLHKRWFEEQALKGESYDPRENVYCGTEGCEADAIVLIENASGVAPLCHRCLSAYEFGMVAGSDPRYRELQRETLS